MAIERRRDYGKKKPTKDAHKVYIVSEDSVSGGAKYFRFFEGLSSNLQVIIIPSSDGKTDPVKLMESAQQYFIVPNDIKTEDDNNSDENVGKKYYIDYENGDTVWFVIDTDKWEELNKIQPLRDFCEEKNKSIPRKLNYKAWNVAQSNPCFEIWLYYHLMPTPPKDYDANKENFKTYFNRHFSNVFFNDRHPKHLDLEEAILNAKANFNKKEVTLFSTEMFKLGTEILPFVKRDLDKLKNKMQ